MARASLIQSSFTSGEFSPLMQGRVDQPRYKDGLGTCLNAIPTLQGPVLRRSGSRYIGQTKPSSTGYDNSGVVLVPFRYSNEQAYVLEFGNGYVRFFTERSQLVVGSTPYELATPYSLPFLAGLKYVQSLDVLYLVHPDMQPYTLKRYGSTDWVLSPIQFSDGPYLDEGLDPTVCSLTGTLTASLNLSLNSMTGLYEVSTQAGDFTNYTIPNIVDNGSGACRITLQDPNVFGTRSQIYIEGAVGTTGANGTWILNQISAYVYDLIGSTFNAAYTANSATISPGAFNINDAGDGQPGSARLIRMKFPNVPWFWNIITGFQNSSLVTVLPQTAAGAAPTDTPEFMLGAWSQTLGYPACATFHDDRLYFGGAGNAPQRLDGSVVSDYLNFAPSAITNADGTPNDDAIVTDSDAVSFTINSNDANVIHSLTSDEYGMPILTSGGSFVMRASSLNVAITPTNVSIKRVDNVGADDLLPVYMGKSTIFLSISTRKIYELTYYYNIDGFRKVDLTEIAHNLPDIGISTNLCFQSSPQPIMWCGRADGTFLGMTFDRNLDVLRTGWSRHVLGGASDASGTPPIIKSFACIPSPDGTEDDVWFIVNRYVNGQAITYVEVLEKIFEEFDEFEDAFMIDSGVTFDNPITVTAITAANPAVVTAPAHGFTTGNTVKFESVIGLESNTGNDDINGIDFVVTAIDSNTFSLNGLDSTYLTPYTSGGVARKQVTTISGLTWLEGETVSILADAQVLPNTVVTSGSITLSQSAGKVQIGLPYTTQIQQLRLEGGSADGTSIGKNRRINEVAVMVDRSYDFEIGTDFNNMTPVDVSETDDFFDSVGLFTGICGRLQVESNYDFQNQLAIQVMTPTPLTISAIMPQQTAYDKG